MERYNTNTKVANFGDYCNNFEKEKEELKKVRRSIKPNTPDTQKYPKNSKLKFNNITRKMDDLTPDIIDDTLKSMEEETNESKIKSFNESSTDLEVLNKLKQLPAYGKLKEDFRKSIHEFTNEVDSSAVDTGYDKGDSDHDMAFHEAIQEAINELVGW